LLEHENLCINFQKGFSPQALIGALPLYPQGTEAHACTDGDAEIARTDITRPDNAARVPSAPNASACTITKADNISCVSYFAWAKNIIKY